MVGARPRFRFRVYGGGRAAGAGAPGAGVALVRCSARWPAQSPRLPAPAPRLLPSVFSSACLKAKARQGQSKSKAKQGRAVFLGG